MTFLLSSNLALYVFPKFPLPKLSAEAVIRSPSSNSGSPSTKTSIVNAVRLKRASTLTSPMMSRLSRVKPTTLLPLQVTPYQLMQLKLPHLSSRKALWKPVLSAKRALRSSSVKPMTISASS
ncbi:hypothetical protein R6Q59_016113 [Mikania micrantha]